MASISLFLHILPIFLPSLSVFCHFGMVSVIFAYLSSFFACHLFFPILPVFESSFSNFCPMLRLAEQCDTKEWYISLAEQNWRTWPPWEDFFLAEQDWVFCRKKMFDPPPKNVPRTPMQCQVKCHQICGCAIFYYSCLKFGFQLCINRTIVTWYF